MARADGVTGGLDVCGCGCGDMRVVHEGDACGCGCGGTEQLSREQELAELTALKESIDRRLNELAS